jgi:DNA-binding LacI/PurR family transcriptional regulator
MTKDWTPPASRTIQRIIFEGDGTLESGRHAVEQLFMRDTLPTAFMCVNDQTAIGVMIGLNARGYDIPRDFSVTGFDDMPQASLHVAAADDDPPAANGNQT